jgi:hypothetical protein
MEFQPVRVAAPAAPSAGATVTLFDSTVVFGGGKRMSMFGVGRVGLSFPGMDKASAANGLNGYTSSDGGTTWDPFSFNVNGSTGSLPTTVQAATASDYDAYDLYVGMFDDVKFTFTADTTAPTARTWRPVVTYRLGDVHSPS